MWAGLAPICQIIAIMRQHCVGHGRGEARVMKEQLREPFFGDPTIRSYEAALQRLIHLSQDQSCLPVSPASRQKIEPLQ
jgi:hypothetical protein